MRVLVAAGWVVWMVGCEEFGSAPGDADAAWDGGPSCTELEWGGPGSGEISRWPEPELVIADETTETGLRLRFDPAAYPELTRAAGGYLGTLTEDLSDVDGFGTNAEAFFRFTRRFDESLLPSGDATEDGRAGLGFVVIAPGEPRIQPVITTTTDEGRTLLLAPMQPLPPRARVAVFVTRALTEAAGGCLEPSSAMADAIANPDPATQEAIEALIELGAIARASDLVAITAFLTQSVTEDSVLVAADVALRAVDWEAAPRCTPEARWIHCEGRFRALDYRDSEDGGFRRARGEPAVPRASYLLTVGIWLPPSGRGPFPVVVYGHGLTGDRNQAARLAEFAAPMGYATVAIDALKHGEHPTARPGAGPLRTLLDFFAIGDLSGRALEAVRLRDHFRQSTWDKLQLTALIRARPDLDGDGRDELDPDRMAYLGVSLGGLMGPELLALSDAYGAGVLVVPGGRVSAIISDGSQFRPLIELLRPRATTPGDVRRFFPILQTVLERGDPASYGPHLLRDRLPGAEGRTPSILVGVVLDDDIVPNVANYALGRAIGVPIVAPLLRAEPGFPVVTGPIAGNFAEGRASGGLLQFDVIGDGMGGIQAATHSNVGDSDVGAAAWLDFLESHFREGVPRIRDPYAAIGLPHAR